MSERFSGKNQRKIVLYLLGASLCPEKAWRTKEEILEGTGLGDEPFTRSVQGLIRRDLVDVKEHPDDARRRVYRRRETI